MSTTTNLDPELLCFLWIAWCVASVQQEEFGSGDRESPALDGTRY